MNRLHVYALAIFTLVGTASQMTYANPLKVPAYFQTIYVPEGYDSNDHIQIVGEGKFSNSCFRQAETRVRIDEAQQKIFLGPVAYSYPGICLMVILPYQKTIDVGILKPGTWEVVQDTNKKVVSEIKVLQAKTESADDYLYAPVSQAFFYQSATSGHVMLTGTFSNSCLRLEEIKITVKNNVVVVQPIAVMKERSNCQNGQFPFAQNTSTNIIPVGRYLLHVRSLNGNAVNSIIDVK